MDKTDLSSNGMEKRIRQIEIKSEPKDDTIKNYAEHTMNELLGLFGYDDKINTTDTENLDLENYSDNKNADSAVVHNSHLKENSKSSARLKSELIKHRQEPGTSINRKCLPEQCAWCRKPGNRQISLETTTGTKVFCSEICFTQHRRASFKRNKMCDWCKNGRNTVNIVEFQDGETVLQFCSEKCSNQYKMGIFCKETQEHLQNMIAPGKDSESGKDEDRIPENLITPELWMRGKKTRLAEKVSESARDRGGRERTQCRDRYKKACGLGLSLDKNSNLKTVQTKLVSEDIFERAQLDKFRLEQNLKSEIVLNAKRSKTTSPIGSENDIKTPASLNFSAMPFQMLHSAIANMSPWLQHAQYMGSFGPGVMPYGHIQPMMMTGLFPHLHSEKIDGTKTLVRDLENNAIKNKTVNEERQSIPNYVLRPKCDHTNDSQFQKSGLSPNLTDRMTSSLFPVDFPQFLPTQEMHNSQNQSTTTGVPVFQSGFSGVPPITMMLPFPVILPFPVPVPIPIPLTVQQLKTLFNCKSENNNSPTKTIISHLDKPKECKSPLLCASSPSSVTPFSIDYCNDLSEVRSDSRNSCPDVSHSSNISYTYNEQMYKNKEYFKSKRSRTSETIQSEDMFRSSKYARYDLSSTSDSNDGVIDLSASRENGHKSDDNVFENGGTDNQINDDNNSSRDSNDNCLDDAPALPKIHIITRQDETPLNESLPLPPTEHPYSSRRGLILDAPVIPKMSKSPSPERRMYVRSVPRDSIEAAKRRCMQARIRTK